MEFIDEKTVKHVALLSRLELDDKELALYSSQLTAILSYINKLNKVDTSQTSPTSRISSRLENVFRHDVEKKSLETEDVLSNAPERQGDFFKIPKVIESFGKSSGFYPALRQAQHDSNTSTKLSVRPEQSRRTKRGERSRTKSNRRIEGK